MTMSIIFPRKSKSTTSQGWKINLALGKFPPPSKNMGFGNPASEFVVGVGVGFGSRLGLGLGLEVGLGFGFRLGSGLGLSGG